MRVDVAVGNIRSSLDSGRPYQLAAEMRHVAAQMEAQGRLKPARESLEKCVQVLEAALGHTHPEVGGGARLTPG